MTHLPPRPSSPPTGRLRRHRGANPKVLPRLAPVTPALLREPIPEIIRLDAAVKRAQAAKYDPMTHRNARVWTGWGVGVAAGFFLLSLWLFGEGQGLLGWMAAAGSAIGIVTTAINADRCSVLAKRRDEEARLAAILTAAVAEAVIPVSPKVKAKRKRKVAA